MAETTGRTLRYIGPHVGVEIPALETTVARGAEIAIADTALAEGLLAQPGNWEVVGGKGKQQAAGTAGEEGS